MYSSPEMLESGCRSFNFGIGRETINLPIYFKFFFSFRKVWRRTQQRRKEPGHHGDEEERQTIVRPNYAFQEEKEIRGKVLK